MQNEELYEEIDSQQSITEKYFALSSSKFLLYFSLVIAFGIYLGVIFFGTNSLEVLIGLEDYEHYLKSEVANLKEVNAELQREYFELKEISAE
jgi:hypothetical protein